VDGVPTVAVDLNEWQIGLLTKAVAARIEDFEEVIEAYPELNVETETVLAGLIECQRILHMHGDLLERNRLRSMPEL
jgi:hypothetical protein